MIKYNKRLGTEFLSSDFNDVFPIFSNVGRWTTHFRHRENRQPSSLICTTNDKLYNLFVNYGYLYKSLVTVPYMDKIPEHLKFYWYRGFIDGDGCWYYNEKYSLRQFHIGGSIDQDWTFITQLFDMLNLKYTLSKKYHKVSNSHSSLIRVTGKKIKILGDYLYQDNIFGLSRKYQKFKTMFPK